MPWLHDQWQDDPITLLQVCPGCIPEDFDARTMQATPCRRHGGHGIAKGSDDARVSVPPYVVRSTENDLTQGDSNRALCDLLHRGRVRRRAPESA